MGKLISNISIILAGIIIIMIAKPIYMNQIIDDTINKNTTEIPSNCIAENITSTNVTVEYIVENNLTDCYEILIPSTNKTVVIGDILEDKSRSFLAGFTALFGVARRATKIAARKIKKHGFPGAPRFGINGGTGGDGGTSIRNTNSHNVGATNNNSFNNISTSISNTSNSHHYYMGQPETEKNPPEAVNDKKETETNSPETKTTTSK